MNAHLCLKFESKLIESREKHQYPNMGLEHTSESKVYCFNFNIIIKPLGEFFGLLTNFLRAIAQSSSCSLFKAILKIYFEVQ